MQTLKLRQIGQIVDAELTFGDLTVLVGAQASGKSIALQMLKLVVDAGQVQDDLSLYVDWSSSLSDFFEVYFGEGMQAIWQEGRSKVLWNGKPVDMAKLVGRKKSKKDQSMFLIPAQRVLAMRDGWPRPFSDYSPRDPFSVRSFSEQLRGLVEKEFGGAPELFPQERRLKSEFRELLQQHVFGDFHLKVDKVRQKRLVLGADGAPLPYMVWSAGQREFVPLLLGLYWLMPPTKVPRRGKIEWVVLEELEMGLHPRAISVVVLMIFELMKRGYRVCISTHSPQVLEAVWALRHLKENDASPTELLAVFGAPCTQAMQNVARTVMEKTVRVFYFDRLTGATRDISDLDPDAEEAGRAGWGGLTEFSARVNMAVARAVANADREEQP
jgi:energy-coupling factor transporter ATP-binding protein EcfA2